MKKVILNIKSMKCTAIILIFSGIGLVSCKKEYTCRCYEIDLEKVGDSSILAPVNNGRKETIKANSLRQAKSRCSSLNDSYNMPKGPCFIIGKKFK